MKKNIEIIPAILPHDFRELREKSDQLVGLSKIVQVDICDGHFVPSFTWPYKKHDINFEKMLSEEEGLPNWEDLDYEFDLMVDEPQEVVGNWVSAGAKRVIIHAEAKGDVVSAVKSVVGKAEAGIALNIDTPLDVLHDLLARIPESSEIFIQLMGIDRIGFQGQTFDEKVLDKIKEVRAMFPEIIISIDGGVSLDTAQKLADAGADRLVVGSAIWNSDNVYEAIQRFKSLTTSTQS